MPTTEIAGFPLIDGVSMATIDDLTTESARRVQEWSGAIVKQQGLQAASYGIVTENPAELVAVLVWDSIHAHIATLRQPEYKAVADGVSTIFAGAGYMFHVDMGPYAEVQKAMNSPVTGFTTLYFDGEPLEESLRHLQAYQEAARKELIGIAIGITHEELEYEGAKGNAVVIMSGWQSTDDHAAFRRSAAYTKHMQGLKEGAAKVQEFHVPLRVV